MCKMFVAIIKNLKIQFGKSVLMEKEKQGTGKETGNM